MMQKNKPNSFRTNKLRALDALHNLTCDTRDRFTCKEIVDYLIEDAKVDIYPQAVRSALLSERGLVNKNNQGYKIMSKGEQLLHEATNSSKGQVIIINPNRPYEAKRKKIPEIFREMSDTVKIIDPYIDINTLDVIYQNIGVERDARILTSKIIDKPSGIFLRQLNEIREEGFALEVGVFDKAEFHDRFIFDESTIWQSGNSLNYLGKKESTLIRLGNDVRESIEEKFNRRWKDSTRIS